MYLTFNITNKTRNVRCQYHKLAWFASYLNDKKQYIKITDSTYAVKEYIKYRVPQGSILRPLLFLL